MIRKSFCVAASNSCSRRVRPMWRARTLAAALVMCVGAANLLHATDSPAANVSKDFPSLNEPSLHNGHRVTEKVLSGAQPEGEESFKALQRLGVKTIVGVDGGTPDVALA